MQNSRIESLFPRRQFVYRPGQNTKIELNVSVKPKNMFLPGTLRQLLVSPLCLVKSSSLLSPQPAEWSAICPSIFVLQKLTSAQKWQRGSLDILSSYSSLID